MRPTAPKPRLAGAPACPGGRALEFAALVDDPGILFAVNEAFRLSCINACAPFWPNTSVPRLRPPLILCDIPPGSILPMRLNQGILMNITVDYGVYMTRYSRLCKMY